MALDCLLHFVRPLPVLPGRLHRRRQAESDCSAVPLHYCWWQGCNGLYYDFRRHVEFWRQRTPVDYFFGNLPQLTAIHLGTFRRHVGLVVDLRGDEGPA